MHSWILPSHLWRKTQWWSFGEQIMVLANTCVYHSSLQGTSEWHLCGMVLVPGHNYSKTLPVLSPDKNEGTFKFQTLRTANNSGSVDSTKTQMGFGSRFCAKMIEHQTDHLVPSYGYTK